MGPRTSRDSWHRPPDEFFVIAMGRRRTAKDVRQIYRGKDLLAIADALGRNSPAREEGATRPSKEKYEAVRARFSLAGMPLRPAHTKEAQWREFLLLRGQYEAALLFVARHTFTPLDGILLDV